MNNQSRFDKILIIVFGIIIPLIYIASAIGIYVFVPLEFNLEQSTLNILSAIFLIPSSYLLIHPWLRRWETLSKKYSHQRELFIGLIFESNLSITGLVLYLIGQPLMLMIILTIISSAGSILWGVQYTKNKSKAA